MGAEWLLRRWGRSRITGQGRNKSNDNKGKGRGRGRGRGGGGSAITAPVITATHNAANNTAADTFAAVNFGTADAGREIIVVLLIADSNAGASYQVDSMTIGGVSATKRVAYTDANNFAHCYVWSAPVPTGTSGTVSFTTNPTGSQGESQAIYVYRMTGHASSTPNASNGAGASGATITPPKGSSGVAGLMTWKSTGSPATTMTGPGTVNGPRQPGNLTAFGSFFNDTDGVTASQVTYTGASDNIRTAVVSWAGQ